MKGQIVIPKELKDTVVGDEEELLDDDLSRVPRSGRRKIMPIERVWDKHGDS